MKIKFFTTGGTIDKVYFDARSEYQVGSPQVREIVEVANVAFDYEIVSLLQKDSLEMLDADRQVVCAAVADDPCDKIIVTHGTDTMIDTARSLLNIPDKTIIFVGAMEPARSRYTDAEFNIGVAIGAVQSLPPNVYVAMSGCIYLTNQVQKNYESRRFEAI